MRDIESCKRDNELLLRYNRELTEENRQYRRSLKYWTIYSVAITLCYIAETILLFVVTR